jgi:acyl-CoA dehydrogenase
MKRRHFNEEQNIYRKSVRSFLEQEVVPHQDAFEEVGQVPKELWQKAGAQGFLCPWADEELGGAGAKDFRYEQVMIEELSRITETGFFVPLHSAVIAPYIADYGNAEQKQRWMPGVISGEKILAVAMTEPSTGSDLASMKTHAEDKGDHWLLNGAKTYISNGIISDLIIVAAKTDKDSKHAMGLFVVEAGQAGFERGRKLKKMGMHSQDTSELFFTDVKIPKENVLGDAKQGFIYLMQKLAQERLATACGAVAAAQAALDMTIEYTKERKAFGRNISRFQNTRFKLAEMKANIEVAQIYIDRCVLEHNAKRFSADDAAIAKLHCTELLGKVADECLQLHGGAGYMWEYPIARLFVGARILRIYAGTSEIMKEIISRTMRL